MIRFFLLVLSVATFSFTALAAEAPAAQTRVSTGDVLRGHFIEEHSIAGVQKPFKSSGHFVVAPVRGLIWAMELPVATTTIITPQSAMQDLGGIGVKLPIKNLRHIYDLVGAALAGDWAKLETDFSITKSGDAHTWQMALTPRGDSAAKLPYTTIRVSGSRFVESIVLTKTDGSVDSLRFSDEEISKGPPTDKELLMFDKINF